MKLSDILLLTLFAVMGSMIFAIKKIQAANNSPAEIAVPAPAVNPQTKSLQDASLPKHHLDVSTPEKAGSYGRLSLDKLLAKGPSSTDMHQTIPVNIVEQTPPPSSIIKRPRKVTG